MTVIGSEQGGHVGPVFSLYTYISSKGPTVLSGGKASSSFLTCYFIVAAIVLLLWLVVAIMMADCTLSFAAGTGWRGESVGCGYEAP